jgi:hypothetical protein
VAEQMKIPEDLQESYEIAKKVGAGEGWCSSDRTALGVVSLIERIAKLEVELSAAREALKEIAAIAIAQYPVSIGNQGAWAKVNEIAARARESK